MKVTNKTKAKAAELHAPDPAAKQKSAEDVLREKVIGLLSRDIDAWIDPGDSKKGLAFNCALMRATRDFARHEEARELMRLLGGDPKHTRPQDFVQPLMDVSSTRDRRLRSRYASTIKLAHHNGVKAKGLEDFLAQNGGYKGCAKEWQKAAEE